MKARVLFLLAAAAVARPAFAQEAAAVAPAPLGARLSWVRAPSAEACPDADRVREAVVRRLGDDPFSRDPGPHIEALVEHAETWKVRLFVREHAESAATERTLQSDAPGCEALAEAAALAIAVAIDPEAAFRAPGTVPARKVVIAPEPVVAAEPNPSHRPFASVRGLVTAGTLPGLLAPGVAIAAGSGWSGAFSWSAGALALPMRRSSDFGFAVTGAFAEGCAGASPVEVVSVRACARVLGGALEAYVFPSESVVSVAPGQYPWAAAALAARIEVRLTKALFVEGELSAVGSLTRQAYVAKNRPDPIFQEDRLATWGGLGVGLHFE